MLNMIRADFYRFFRSKGLYITEAVLAVLVIALILYYNYSGYGKTGIDSLAYFYDLSAFLIYIGLPLFTMTIGYELTHGLLKNVLTSGISRGKYFLSKYLVFVVLSFFQFIFYYILVFSSASLIHGIGNTSSQFWGQFLASIPFQLLVFIAEFSIGIFVLYLSFSNVGATLTIVFVPVAISMVSDLVKPLHFLTYFDFLNMMSTDISSFHGDFPKVLLAAVGTIIVLSSLAFYRFKTKDLW